MTRSAARVSASAASAGASATSAGLRRGGCAPMSPLSARQGGRDLARDARVPLQQRDVRGAALSAGGPVERGEEEGREQLPPEPSSARLHQRRRERLLDAAGRERRGWRDAEEHALAPLQHPPVEAEERRNPGRVLHAMLERDPAPGDVERGQLGGAEPDHRDAQRLELLGGRGDVQEDRKSTRLNSSHVEISYAVFCLKKKK